MADLKPVYLVSGDDDAKIDEWRARVRGRAESEGGPGALEAFDPGAQPADVAAALATLTFATGTRFVLADRVDGWKAGDLEPLEDGLKAMPPDTVLVLIARGKAPARLTKAVEAAGGELRDYPAPKQWELPKWVIERAREHGLELDTEAAKTLVAIVGAGQQRLMREVEKLAIAAGGDGRLGADDVAELAAGDNVPQAYALADALVAGEQGRVLALAEELRDADEKPGKLAFRIVPRLREVHRAAEMLEAGASDQQVAGALKTAPWIAKRVVQQAQRADREALERAIEAFADLEIELRGGGTGLDESTAFTLTLARAASA